MAQAYAEAWESYWHDTKEGQGEAVWDSPPEQAAALHVPLFEDLVDPTLPWLDLGCGNGTQSRFLAERFGRVVGIDLSPTAIQYARAEDPDKLVDFRILSALDAGAVRALRAELGDVNVYMRGILHQSRPEDRPVVAAAVAQLIGSRGVVFDVEMAASSKSEIQRLAAEAGGSLPKFTTLFTHGLTPSEAADDSFPAFFREAGLTVARVGDTSLHSTENGPTGTSIVLPMRYLAAHAPRE